jgi:hypothetical protein
MHEMLHTAGFLHEQSRSDRDEHVAVIEANFDPKFFENFEKFSANLADTLDLPYDVGSLMHYAANAFSNNGRVTFFLTSKTRALKVGQLRA